MDTKEVSERIEYVLGKLESICVQEGKCSVAQFRSTVELCFEDLRDIRNWIKRHANISKV